MYDHDLRLELARHYKNIGNKIKAVEYFLEVYETDNRVGKKKPMILFPKKIQRLLVLRHTSRRALDFGHF